MEFATLLHTMSRESSNQERREHIHIWRNSQATSWWHEHEVMGVRIESQGKLCDAAKICTICGYERMSDEWQNWQR